MSLIFSLLFGVTQLLVGVMLPCVLGVWVPGKLGGMPKDWSSKKRMFWKATLLILALVGSYRRALMPFWEGIYGYFRLTCYVFALIGVEGMLLGE